MPASEHLLQGLERKGSQSLRVLGPLPHLTGEKTEAQSRVGRDSCKVPEQADGSAGFNTMLPGLGKLGHVLAGRLSSTAFPKGTGLVAI